MPECNGGSWWNCVDHIYNNYRFKNCSIYDDHVSYITYKGNREKLPIFQRINWIKFLISNLTIHDYELIDIGLDKKEIVTGKLINQLKYLEAKNKNYLLELQEQNLM